MSIRELALSAIIIIIFSSFITISAVDENQCGGGTVLNPQTKQCVPECGEGTTPNKDGKCVIEKDTIFDEEVSEIDLIIYGVIIGAVATIFGIIWTVWERRKTNKKEDVELIQQYGAQLSEIMNSESSLETKIDCSLYVERYLDTLEQIASLYKKGSLRKNVD